MNTTRFKTAAEAAAHLAEDPSVEGRVNQEIKRNEIVSLLMEMRVSKGVTQEQIANSMGCDPSTVSRIESIESGNDRQLKWTDIVGYASALKLQMNILFDDESLPAAARIKQCVLKIDEDLKKLAQLAEQVGGDDKISQEISRFYKEVLFNFLLRYVDNNAKLKSVINIPSKPAACPPSPTALPEAKPNSSPTQTPQLV
jgi:transcriptional regulator with XRE-family HTH domain